MNDINKAWIRLKRGLTCLVITLFLAGVLFVSGCGHCQHKHRGCCDEYKKKSGCVEEKKGCNYIDGKKCCCKGCEKDQCCPGCKCEGANCKHGDKGAE